MPELVSWQGRKGLSLEESQGDPASRHKEPVMARPGRCLCRWARRALPGLSVCSLFWNPWFKGRHWVLKWLVLACQLTEERRAGSAGSVILSGRRQWPPAGVTDRPALRATANLLSPSTRTEREDTASSLAGGGAEGGGGLRAGGFEREPLT